MRYRSVLALTYALLGSAWGAEQEILSEGGNRSDDSLLWGPYKPNLYFGIKPRIPESLTSGLLWGRVEEFQGVNDNFRHTCEQHSGMAGYGWDEYDARTGGRQTIHDSANRVDITTEFVKFPGGEHGGSWGLRVKGVPREDASARPRTAVVFYSSLAGIGSLAVKNTPETLGFDGDVDLGGETKELGNFNIRVTRGPGTNKYPVHTHETFEAKPLDRTIVASLTVPPEGAWMAKNILFMQMKAEIDRYIEQYGQERSPPPEQVFTVANSAGTGNFHIVQKVFEGAFEFDVIFQSGSAPKDIDSADITKAVKSNSAGFADRFAKTLGLQKPFTGKKWQEFSHAMFSNLAGGIGYFYGDQIVDKSYADEYEEANEGFWEETAAARAKNQIARDGPYELFTSIPSRPFFPRGFLWDEGFHLVPIADWDMSLTLEIVRSWYKLIDEDGWIAREQILGDEARSKVPSEFTVQYPHYANPPTLFLILEAFTAKLQAGEGQKADKSDPFDAIRNAQLRDRDAALAYLKEVYPLVKRQYFWFRKTQAGDITSYERDAFSTKEAYRWRGRSVEHILTSGLDDYPRAQPPHPGELHVDLMSWVGMGTRSLKNIARFLGEKDDVAEFEKYETAILRNLDDLHWSEAHQTYCDATVDDYEENVHVCHKGYISIFPFMTGLLGPDHPHLGAILDLISDPEELWSDYGIRSLSKKDEFYNTGENYWRSPVWMNMNYLVVKNLYDIAKQAGPYQKKARAMYADLRTNLVENVYKEWKRTGFAWEQYNPENGEGQRTQHFTGWTSLVVKIMAMEDLGSGSSQRKDEL